MNQHMTYLGCEFLEVLGLEELESLSFLKKDLDLVLGDYL